MKAFDIFLNGRYFDTLVFGTNKSTDEVKRSLKYSGKITVKAVRIGSGE